MSTMRPGSGFTCGSAGTSGPRHKGDGWGSITCGAGVSPAHVPREGIPCGRDGRTTKALDRIEFVVRASRPHMFIAKGFRAAGTAAPQRRWTGWGLWCGCLARTCSSRRDSVRPGRPHHKGAGLVQDCGAGVSPAHVHREGVPCGRDGRTTKALDRIGIVVRASRPHVVSVMRRSGALAHHPRGGDLHLLELPGAEILRQVIPVQHQNHLPSVAQGDGHRFAR